MLQYACEWCKKVKRPQDEWILGFAAEKIGLANARREITVASAWHEEQAVHPLAVHFCSENHKDRYVAALFERAPVRARTTVETTVETVRPRRAMRKVVRTVTPLTKTKRTVVKRKKSA